MKSRYVNIFVVAGLATGGLLPPSVQAQLVDLGATTGYAINNSGEAALASGLCSNGTVTPLPALPGAAATPAIPLTINASGQVGGKAAIPASGTLQAIQYGGGVLTNIGANFIDGGLGSQPAYSLATGINTNGMVVGYYDANSRDSIWPAFTYLNGTVTQIPVPCSPTSTQDCSGVSQNFAYGINDSGEIVGSVDYDTLNILELPDAYVYSNGVWRDFGAGSAYAINGGGQVTGTLTTYTLQGATFDITGTIAFLYSNGTITNLGTLPGGQNSTGYAINITGAIVGSSDFAGQTTRTHGFFYNGVMTDLNSLVSPSDPLQPFVTLASGVAINDSRLILANGVDSRSGATHAYLLQGPWINVGPTTLTFAAEAVGATSPSQSVTVSNSSTSAIALGTIRASANFSIESNSCTASLAPAGQCTVAIAYTPATAGAAIGTLTVPSAGVNYSVSLSGSATISGSIVASVKTATVGQSLSLTWNVSAGSTCTASSTSTNTAWTASKPPFMGTVPASGEQNLTENVAGTMTYALQCTAPGTGALGVSTSVVWTWPPVTVSISGSPTSITAGEAVTLTWNSSSATTCSANGGGQSDGWPGAKATSGSQTVTESFAPAIGTATLVYTITCTSSTSGLTSHASAQVLESTPPSNSGGGGQLDLVSLAGLLGVLALSSERTRRRA